VSVLDHDAIAAFRLNRVKFIKEGKVEAVTGVTVQRPLAVMPHAPGLHTSHLIMGTLDSPTLLVLSLPDHLLFHTHTMEDVVTLW
jgi:hypothetical protein